MRREDRLSAGGEACGGGKKEKKESSPQPDKDTRVRAGFSSTLFVRLIYDNI